MKDIRPARPKNLATKTVAWPWASGVSIHCKQGLRIHDSLQPFRRTRQPLQLIFLIFYLIIIIICVSKFQVSSFKSFKTQDSQSVYMNKPKIIRMQYFFEHKKERKKEREREREGME